jgi:hypothetical protein
VDFVPSEVLRFGRFRDEKHREQRHCDRRVPHDHPWIEKNGVRHSNTNRTQIGAGHTGLSGKRSRTGKNREDSAGFAAGAQG